MVRKEDSGPSTPPTWLRATLLFGLAYFTVGRAFAQPGEHAHAWRIAASW
ncbi:MAG TPA: hypothetical protein VJT85_00925 [Gemmatimonadaceae bacterium]|nr:hypothetical protein [Gemmatimonadaceae bacterium]